MTEPSASPEQKSECIKMFTVTNSASNSREMDEKSPARYQKKKKKTCQLIIVNTAGRKFIQVI